MQKRVIGSLPEKTGAFSTESNTSARKIEFLLNNAVDAADYAQAMKEARKITSRAKRKIKVESSK